MSDQAPIPTGIDPQQASIQEIVDAAHDLARQAGALGFFRGALLATVEQVEDEILADLHRLPADGAATGGGSSPSGKRPGSPGWSRSRRKRLDAKSRPVGLVGSPLPERREECST